MAAYTGILGIVSILALAFALSNQRRAINWRLVTCGLCLQIILAVFILRVPMGRKLFQVVGHGVEVLLQYSDAGAGFVFGPLVSDTAKMTELFGPAGAFIFAFKLVPTIIFVSALASIAYHIGLLPWVIRHMARWIDFIMGASGSEALSNSASVFVGQIEAQLLIKPYVSTLTMSEMLAVMSGSMACIAGGVMAVYIQMGIPASYLMAASLMAIPGSLVISKLMYPETEKSPTQGEVKITLEHQTLNLIDAITRGASEGLKIGLTVCAVLIAFVALIAMANGLVGMLGVQLAQWIDPASEYPVLWGMDLNHLTLDVILGRLFKWVALLLGVAPQDADAVGALMGTKLILNEFVSYSQLAPMIRDGAMDPRSIVIATFALCGFANLGSVAMQIGGIGEMAPNRKGDLAKLGLKALLCGTMASYLSSALAGVLSVTSGSGTVVANGAVMFLFCLAMAVLIGVNWVHHTTKHRRPRFQDRLDKIRDEQMSRPV